MQESPALIARSLDPRDVLSAIRDAGITHVITVPDTHQRTLLALLSPQTDPQLVTVCTEDEAFALAAGLHVGGARPLLLIQNAGLFASMNSLRGIALDGRVPMPLLIGEYFRDPTISSKDHTLRVVGLTEPTLELWGVPYYRLEVDADLTRIGEAVVRAHDECGPVGILVGAPTREAL
jgi:sulfopyruvate decarboxylase subunit alpha